MVLFMVDEVMPVTVDRNTEPACQRHTTQRQNMRNDTTFTVSDVTVTLSGETRTFATIKVAGCEFTGEVGNPEGAPSLDAWLSQPIRDALDAIECDIDRADVLRILHAEMC